MVLHIFLVWLLIWYIRSLDIKVTSDGDLKIFSPNRKWFYGSYSRQQITSIDREDVFELTLGKTS